MLKQSLVQEKLSDLTMAAAASASTSSNNNATTSVVTATTSVTNPSSSSSNNLVIQASDLHHHHHNQNSNDLILPHMPQWPRVQIDKNIHSNLVRSSSINVKSRHQNSNKVTIQQDYSTLSPPSSSNVYNSRSFISNSKNFVANDHANSNSDNSNNSTNTNNNTTTTNNNTNHKNSNDYIEYDGIETVNFYSNYRSNNLNENFNHNNHNNNNDFSGHNNNSSSNNYSLNPNSSAESAYHSTSMNGMSNGNSSVTRSDSHDPTLKLRYLEKSIKFIQQQHNETLTSLHQEIEKLKSENRDLLFKLATRKSSSGSERTLSASNKNSEAITTTIKSLNLTTDINKEQISQKGFDKAFKETHREPNLDKRLNDIKTNYENNKYEELYSRLRDAESKNEYLTSIITQLQSKRSANSGYRPNVNVNKNSSSSAHGTVSSSTNYQNLTSANTVNSNSSSNTNNNNNTNKLWSKLNLNHIYSVEPLRIKLNDNDEPRAPTLEESEVLIKKLFELYKQQKQQISNMKVVLKDMMNNENLSNQGMMITKDILENPSRFSQYFLENNSNIRKISILTPLTNYGAAPHSSNGNRSRYHSQLLASLASANPGVNDLHASGTSSHLNLSSTVHLPPLQTINPAKFPERQRRTQILQKQRLRKEYFH